MMQSRCHSTSIASSSPRVLATAITLSQASTKFSPPARAGHTLNPYHNSDNNNNNNNNPSTVNGDGDPNFSLVTESRASSVGLDGGTQKPSAPYQFRRFESSAEPKHTVHRIQPSRPYGICPPCCSTILIFPTLQHYIRSREDRQNGQWMGTALQKIFL
jgi:hypothetical protein